MIYYILIAYIGMFLYRYYMKTTDPTIKVVPFHNYGLLPLRTKKNNWLDVPNSLWSYLHIGADGPDYNALVRSTEDYMDAQKASIPDYNKLERQFNLKPLFNTFENHLINMNLPGFMPLPSADKSIDLANKILAQAHALDDISKATSIFTEADKIEDVQRAIERVKEAQTTIGTVLEKSPLSNPNRATAQEAKRTLNKAVALSER